MTNHRDMEWLLGRRFGCDFRVVGFGPDPPPGCDRVVLLHMNGDNYGISLGELRTLIERGLVMELPERG